MLNRTYNDLKDSYTEYLQASLKPEWEHVAKQKSDFIYANRTRYEEIETITGVPWYVVGVIHIMEANGDFQAYLGNGQKLSHRTTMVPKGRGPFKTWKAGALDAIRIQGMDKEKDWTDEKLCYWLEKFNGMGYRGHEVPSPYLCSGLVNYHHGKYLTDGDYSPSAVSEQIGAIPIMREIKKGPYLSKKAISEESRKLGTISRVKNVIKGGVISLGAAISADNLNTGFAWIGELRQFVQGHALLFLVLALGLSYATFWLVEHYIIQDYKDGRYTPSGGNNV